MTFLSTAFLCIGPPALAAGPRIHPLNGVPVGASFAGTDGEHVVYTVGQPADVTAGVLDARSGNVTPLTLPSPERCSVAGGTGGIAAMCEHPVEGYTLWLRDYASQQWRPLPQSEFTDHGTGLASWVTGVGRAYLKVAVKDVHTVGAALISRASGSTVTAASGPFGRRWLPTLDRTTTTRKLCAPLTQSLEPPDDETGFRFTAPFLYAKPWGLDAPAPPSGTGTTAFRLVHCASRNSTRICTQRTAGPPCRDPSLTTNDAAWSKGSTAHLRNLRTKQTTSFRRPGHALTLHLLTSSALVITDQGTRDSKFGILRP